MKWNTLARKEPLSEAFIEEHQDKMSWKWISGYQDLSETFMEKHQDKLRWEYIFRSQMMSFDFIKKFMHKEDVHFLLYNEKIGLTKEKWDELKALKESIF